MSKIISDNHGNRVTRRRFLGTTAAVAASSVLPFSLSCTPKTEVIPKGIGGVRVGAITYSFRTVTDDAAELLSHLVNLGMDTVELMGGPAEAYAGAPSPPSWSRVGTDMTDEDRAAFMAARQAYNEEAGQWRLSASMDKFTELGQMYRDAGVEIDILKLGDPRWSDELIDYAFNAARAVGARGICFEISNEGAERIGPFCDKHQMLVGLHNHTQVADEGFSFDIPLSYSPYNMLNLDVGHYVAGTNESPIPIIEQYHDRISHLHLKDRKTGANGGDNVPWGEGDTPLTEILQLLQREKYDMTAMIELEHEIPEGSDVVTEMGKCVEYCKNALL